MDDNKLEKENNLDNGGNLVDEDIWDDTRSAVCCIKYVHAATVSEFVLNDLILLS